MAEKTFVKTSAQCRAVKLLTGEALHTLLFGGSRSGKTFIIVRQIVLRALMEPGSRHCILRKYFAMNNKSIVNDTFPKVMQICFPQVPYTLNKSLFFVRFPNDSEIWFGGYDGGDKILGNEYSTIYFNEVSEFSFEMLETAYSRNAQKCSKLKNRFYYDENPVGKSHWSYKLFVEGKHPIDGTPVKNPGNYTSMRMNPSDNTENLSETYLEQLRNLSAKQRKRFLEGEWQDDNENALWKRASMIDQYRVGDVDPGELDRIVVAVDPAATSGQNADETGIVVAGIKRGRGSAESQFYILEDGSLRGSPSEWAQMAIDLYWAYSADRVVAEVNNGGEMIEALLRDIDPQVSYCPVRATRGKILRAEPIAALYEKGRVHHSGAFPLLEDQMCNFTGAVDEKSPDRLDALVWALTQLSGAKSGKVSSAEMAFTY